MIKVQIKKDGTLTHASEHETLELAQAWLAKHEAKNTFGIPTHTIQNLISEEIPAEYDEEGNETSPLVEAVYEEVQVPAEYTIEIEDVTVQNQIEQEKQNRIATGKKARQDCENVLDLIGGYNIERNLTFEQKTEMKLLFSQTKEALNDFQPGYAKYFILQIVPDEVLCTTEMKNDCLALLIDWEVPQ